MRYLITGATGFIGGYIAQACLARGRQVVTIARAASNTAELEKKGVVVHRGDVTEPQTVRRAMEEVEVVIHCAAKVGHWGPLADFRAVNVEGLRNLLDASKGQALARFLQMSSLGVYAPKHHYRSDETVPPYLRHRDSYSQSKSEAEQLALQYYRDFGVPVVILRPGFVYGPGDKNVMPKIIEGLRQQTVRLPGGGSAALNTIFIRNLVDAVFLAIERQEAVGQIYNLTDGEYVSKKHFIHAVADALGLPHPHLKPPYWLAKLVARCCEGWARMRGYAEAPRFNMTSFKFLAMNLDFSIEKAIRELGYHPRVKFDDAIAETMAWYKPAPSPQAQ